jgi:glycine C-acetyltransferase
MSDLEKKLQEAQKNSVRVIVTDGVFSMDGDIADLKIICIGDSMVGKSK